MKTMRMGTTALGLALAALPVAARAQSAAEQLEGAAGAQAQSLARGVARLQDKVARSNAEMPAALMGESVEIRAAVSQALEAAKADRQVKVESLEVRPTCLGYLHTFKARVIETGIGGPLLSRRCEVSGTYNTLTKRTSVMEKKVSEI